MTNLEDFLKPTQKGLFNLLCKKYRGEAIACSGSYILVRGEAPIMLLAHMDTVHEKPVKLICRSADGDTLMSPQGIGGDDRCGVYALVKAYEIAPIKPWLLFTCDEEIGGLGAEKFAEDYRRGKLPKGLGKLKLLVEIDRNGSRDAVYYSCDNPEFEAYITRKGFVTASGSFSDISIIAPEMGVAAVNLSSGYYNAHTLHEYIICKEIEAVIRSVVGIIADAAKSDFPEYKYIERVWEFSEKYGSKFSTWDLRSYDIPCDLPNELVEIYDDLLDVYLRSDLEQYRREYGDWILLDIYQSEFGLQYDNDLEEQKQW